MKSIFNNSRKKLTDPFLEFINDTRAVGILLLLCTGISLTLANSHFANSYFNIIQATTLSIANVHLPHTVLHWINDGLMTIFFFLAGMEIKREITCGELSSFSQAILPLIAAIGGMLAPALIFLFVNNHTSFQNGWGIPMATDIAFSLGIAALLGKKVPIGLKIFLTALAIIDDIGAILAIALFYSSTINWVYIILACIIILSLFILLKCNRFGFYTFILGVLLWYCFLNSGIHATIAGVLFAFFIPANKLHTIEHYLNKPVNLLIIPIFALANTAIILPSNFVTSINNTLSWGIIAGLLIGKPLGIFLSCFFTVKFKWGKLPNLSSWQHIIGAGLLAGIGFTMSIFIATLAFNDLSAINISKIAILLGSFLSIIFGFVWLRFFCKPFTI